MGQHGTDSDLSTVDSDARVARRVRLVVAWVLTPVIILAVTAMVLLWPDRGGIVQDVLDAPRGAGTVQEITPCTVAPKDCDIATLALTDGPGAGSTVSAVVPRASGVKVSVGQTALVAHYPTRLVEWERYEVEGPDRSLPLGLLALVFCLAVIALSRWRGLAALGALGLCLAGLTEFVMPAIIHGANPLLVAVVGGTVIMVAALFLTHGFNARTAVAVLGTAAGLTLTGVLGYGSLEMAGITGLGSDNVGFLSGYLEGVDLQGLLLAGLVIGALGVLDDVTVTQATVVWELAAADPSASRAKLFSAGLRVGRAHVASTVNTLVLAYAGVALPLLMLFAIRGMPGQHVISSAAIAEEVVRALVGSLGIIAAVPLTTLLAALAVGGRGAAVVEVPEQDPLPETPRADLHAGHVQ
ncbi:YibE/F family protein [Crossiella cryophila]|uniref:Putative membrane protein n=1 Tax=Crossiella cryophila TaxID=43355 RepID=A0A7W7CA53_9PSEU|nr:YibE/F family protein [Crossiella cryophila]MBB4677380.1 putative membrane protein [Crossiella cryophila]